MDSEWFIQLKTISGGIRSPSITVLKPVRRNKFLRRYKFGTGSAVTSQVANGSELYYGTSKVTTTFTNSEYTTSYVSIYEIEPRFSHDTGVDVRSYDTVENRESRTCTAEQ